MPAGYSSQPISGFTGHMPGAKWQVGRRYAPPGEAPHYVPDTVTYQQQDAQFHPSFGSSLQQASTRQNEVHFSPSQRHELVDEGTQSEMSFRQDPIEHGVSYVNGIHNGVDNLRSQAGILSPGSSNVSMGFDSQGRPIRLHPSGQQQVHHSSQVGYQNGGQIYYQNQGNFHQQGIAVGEPHPRAPQTIYDHEGRPIEMFIPPSQQQLTEFPSQAGHHVSRAERSSDASARSRSLPRRRIEKDPFEGVESGWWSKGEVLRNRERREMAEKGRQIQGGDWNPPKMDQSPPRAKAWKEKGNELDDIPAAGYSGHIQGLRQIGVGKPFHRAAKEAKEQYVERRRALSGGREQFYSNGNSYQDGGSEQLNYAHTVAASGMHTRSAF